MIELVEPAIDDRDVPPVVRLTREEMLADLERRIQRMFGIGSDEFYRRIRCRCL